MSIRVLLADDHPLFLDGLRLLLETAGLTVVGAAGTGAELLALAAEHEADVAVVDVDMPAVDGVTAVAELRRRHPRIGVLMLTMHDDAASVRRALDAGALGYVLKGAGHGAVVRAVQAVAEGDTVLSGGVGPALLGGGDPYPLPQLTAREREVLERVARGEGNAVIARALHVSLKTVQNNVSSIFGKLGVSTRAEAVARARDAGIGG
ncbi:UNVERIFIED_ORG: response regulator transcription factor [Bacillus sp. AZ43]